MTNPDVLTHVEECLDEARAAAARAYDRVDALGRLRSLLYGIAAQENSRVLTPEQMWRSVTTPEAEAELQALLDRALPEPTTKEPA